MAEDKKVTISRTLNGKIIYFIARNSTGKIIARELTQEKLEKAIKAYKEPPTIEEESQGEGVIVNDEEEEPKEKKFLTNMLSGKVQERKEEQEVAEPEEGEKKFLENELRTKVEERKQQSKKKSFWDKLK